MFNCLLTASGSRAWRPAQARQTAPAPTAN